MSRLIALLACVAAGFGLFYLSARTPAPLPVTAPPGVFSAGRAMIDDAAMAPAPHPVGSAANARVRDYLIHRMAALGLSPQIQRAESRRAKTYDGETYVGGADVENIVGVLPGRDRALPALALMAHYDSVPGSPGAADDIASVSAILEIVRAIEVAGVPARDVMVVITDGEEAGLLGASAFFAANPLARHAGFILNLETRGGGGRANMFETGAMNGGAIDLFARTAAAPASTSLSVFVYQLLPNDTDFSIAKANGYTGFNYAFIGRQFDYHSPSSTVAALDKGSVQHMGQEVLGTARAAAFSRTLPIKAPDKVYADVFGAFVIAYPPAASWLALIAAAALIALGAWRASALAWRDVLRGVAATAALLIGAALALALTRHLTGAGFGFTQQRPILARFPLLEVAMAASSLGVTLLTARVVARRRARLAGVWTGLLLTALLGAAALQIAAPTIAFVIAWPLIAAALVSALTAAGEVRRPIGAGLGLIVIAVTLGWLGGLFHGVLQGLDIPEAPAAIVWLAAVVLWPLAWPGPFERWRLASGAGALIAGLAIALFMNVTSPWSPRHPQAAEPLYVVNAQSGRAWRADAVAPGAWSRAVLTADGGTIGALHLPGLAPSIAAAPARAVSVSAPTIVVTRGIDGTVTLRAPWAANVLALRLDLRCDTLVTGAMVDGQPTPILNVPGHWTHLRWQAAPEGLTVSFKPAGPGTLTMRWAQYLDGWPLAAIPLPPMPSDVMGWDMAASTVAVGARRVRL
ncbi:MAG: M20/M25/M40 family metallo-hydrolase [Pseudomonadota bacterium]|nr:M20/M25/M40 family metallo-hydrolase [Pseudomonadota bacterium]